MKLPRTTNNSLGAALKPIALKMVSDSLGPAAAAVSSTVASGLALKDTFSNSRSTDGLTGLKKVEGKLKSMVLKARSQMNQPSEAVVLITGAGRGNPYGHAAIGIPDKGLLNLGTSETGFNFGEQSVDDYIAGELPHRNVEVFTVPMTFQQRLRLEAMLKEQDGRVDSMGERVSYATGETCTRVSAQPLEELGLIERGSLPGLNPFRNVSDTFDEAFPSTLRGRLKDRGYESVTKAHVATSNPGLEQAAADQFMRGMW